MDRDNTGNDLMISTKDSENIFGVHDIEDNEDIK